jgi:hypothetical protein
VMVDTFQIYSRGTDRTPDRALMASRLNQSPSRFSPPSQTRSTGNASGHCIHKPNRRRRSITRPPKRKTPKNRRSRPQLTKWIPATSGISEEPATRWAQKRGGSTPVGGHDAESGRKAALAVMGDSWRWLRLVVCEVGGRKEASLTRWDWELHDDGIETAGSEAGLGSLWRPCALALAGSCATRRSLGASAGLHGIFRAGWGLRPLDLGCRACGR